MATKQRRRLKPVLVDTDVLSFLMKQGHELGAKYAKHVRGRTLAVSFVTVGEILTGAKRRGWSPARVATFRARLQSMVVIPFDLGVCEHYATLGTLKTPKGSDRTIAANDRWIAACALRHGLALVTNNRRHFEGIPGLEIITEAPPLNTPRPVPLPLDEA